MSNHPNKPTPAILHICTTGVNHSMQFRTTERATIAFDRLSQALTDYQKLLAEFPAGRGSHIEHDDYGTSVVLDLGELKSARVTNIAQEHEAAGNLKLAEAYAAIAFQESMADHPAVKILMAQLQQRGGKPGLIVPN